MVSVPVPAEEECLRVVTIDGGPLGIEDVVAVADGDATVVVGPGVAERMRPARELVEQVVAENRTVYGITTGFGRLATTRIEPEEAAQLQVRLLRSHAAGVGARLRDRTVRAMLLLRARTLAQGHSGVRPVIVERLVDLLNHGVLPVVPGQGSVGASGDLAPFAHLALPLIGEGVVRVDGVEMDSATALKRAGLRPITLAAKEGLSLLNGTEGMLALGVLALHRARILANAADVACALSVEGLLGSSLVKIVKSFIFSWVMKLSWIGVRIRITPSVLLTVDKGSMMIDFSLSKARPGISAGCLLLIIQEKIPHSI